MIILDFLFYFLTYWFELNMDNLSWNTPIKKSTYVIGLATIGLLFSIGEAIELSFLKNTSFHVPKLIFIIFGLVIMQLYDYIYITRGRYVKISTIEYKVFSDIAKSKGVMISFVIIVLSLFTPFFVFMISMPFGGHSLNK